MKKNLFFLAIALLFSLVGHAACAGQSEIYLPEPGTTLLGESCRFFWKDTGVPGTEYGLRVETEPNTGNIYHSGPLQAGFTNADVAGLPTNGETVHVILTYRIGSLMPITAYYTFTAANYTREPIILDPDPGSRISGDSALFSWALNGAECWSYTITAGTRYGADDLYNSGEIHMGQILADGPFDYDPHYRWRFTHLLTGLPMDNSTVYIRLYYGVMPTPFGNFPLFVECEYTSAGLPAIIFPPPKSRLWSDTITFVWMNNGEMVDAWELVVGTNLGHRDVYESGWLGSDEITHTVPWLPANGGAIYVRLWYKIGDELFYQKYTYTASGHGGFDASEIGDFDDWDTVNAWGDSNNQWFATEWDTGLGGTTPCYTSFGVSGKLHSAIYKPNGKKIEYDNFEYSTKFVRYGHYTALSGLIFRGSPSADDSTASNLGWDSGYGFFITRDGHYYIMKIVNGELTSLVDPPLQQSAAIQQGTAWNKLSIRAVGPRMEFYINDDMVATVIDYDYARGRVGLGLTGGGHLNVLYVGWAGLEPIYHNPNHGSIL